MANYTSTTLKFTEKIGDSVIGGNMITSGTLTISPKSGYVVTASDFSVPTLPDNITSVAFTDVQTAGQPGNTVTATITFGPLFTVAANKVVNLNISGDAKIYNPSNETIPITITIKNDTTLNVTGYATINDIYSGFTETNDLSGNPRIHYITGNVIKNKSTKIAELDIIVGAGYYFKNKPYITYEDESITSGVTLNQTSVVYNDENRINRYKFDILFKGDKSITKYQEGSDINVVFNATTSTAITKEIKNITCGDLRVSPKGATRMVTIFGDKDAEFDLTITKDSDGSSILNTAYQNADVFDSASGIIRGFNKTFKRTGSCGFIQNFPAGTDKYYIKAYAKGSSTLSSSLSTLPQITIEQYANPTLTITRSTSNATIVISAATVISYTGVANTDGYKLRHTSTPDRFSIAWTFTCTGGGKNFTTIARQPKFSSTDASNSDFSDSLYSSNNGTHIEMTNLKAVIAGDTHSATITADVLIKKWGTTDTTMSINVASIFNTN